MNTHRFVIAFAFASVALVPAAGQTWLQKFQPNNPVGLVNAGAAYDAVHGQMLLFGGFSLDIPGNFSNNTYVWDGQNWKQMSPDHSPSARQFPSMAFDAARGNVVLFGGVDPNMPVGDTWVWEVSPITGKLDWIQKSPNNSPSPRAATMAYDAARAQVVLFSGNLNSTETWAWDGNNWTVLSTQNSPSARVGHMMAYDAARKQVVLFGGNVLNGLNAETWTWGGTNWAQKTPAHSPPARSYAGMAYDAVRARVLLFGGLGSAGFTGDTWAWDGASWTQIVLTMNPGARWAPVMAFDKGHNQMVMFGGQQQPLLGDIFPITSDTWVWTNIVPTAGSPQPMPTGSQSPAPMEVTVVDDTGHYERNAFVRFAGPRSLVSLTPTSVTDTRGRATVPANATSTAGSYTVTASLPNGNFTTFTLSNVNTKTAGGACQVTTPADDDSSGSLRYQVAACGRGGVITFRPGITTVFLSHGADIQLTQDLTIDGGAGVTIDARGQSRIFFVQGGSITLQHLTLKNGLARGGNGGNGAYPGGGAAGMGGAMFINAGTLVTVGVMFSNNSAQGGSGGSVPPGGDVISDVIYAGGGGMGGDSFGSSCNCVTQQFGPDHFSQGGGGGDLRGSGGFDPGVNGGPGAGSALNGTAGFGGGGSSMGILGTSHAGFGGGGGAFGVAGTFGGSGDTSPTGGALGGGGGAGLGGAIFVQSGALLMAQASFTGNTANGGLPGTSASATSGQGKGGALFVNSGAIAAYFGAAPSYSGDVAVDSNTRTVCGAAVGASAVDTNDICGVLSQANIVITSGHGQTTPINTAFPKPLVATLTAGGRGVPGVPVSFFGPASGASTNPVVKSAVTNSAGAASVTVSANGIVGGVYASRAYVTGMATGAAFGLTNTNPDDLTIRSAHIGNFFQGQTGATYTITVTNSGTGPTNGTAATLVDTLPAGLTPTAISGTGWSCALTGLTCNRSNVLNAGASYPVVTITVNVATNAGASLTNLVTVSGADSIASNNTGSDQTTITAGPDLQITMTHTGNFHRGDPADTYRITVANIGAAASQGAITLTDALPLSLTATAFIGPAGWSCTLSPLACTTSGSLAVASSAQFTLTVSVASTAPSSLINQAGVQGGSDQNPQNNNTSDATIIVN